MVRSIRVTWLSVIKHKDSRDSSFYGEELLWSSVLFVWWYKVLSLCNNNPFLSETLLLTAYDTSSGTQMSKMPI